MRVDKHWNTLALVAFTAFTLSAFLYPDAFANLRGHAGEGVIWLALSLLVAGGGASLSVDAPALGDHAHLSVPLFLALAAPYALRLPAFGALVRRLLGPSPPIVAVAGPRPYPEGAPAAIPARVATALIAAARARGSHAIA